MSHIPSPSPGTISRSVDTPKSAIFASLSRTPSQTSVASGTFALPSEPMRDATNRTAFKWPSRPDTPPLGFINALSSAVSTGDMVTSQQTQGSQHSHLRHVHGRRIPSVTSSAPPKRPTPDSRAFQRPAQLKRKLPVSARPRRRDSIANNTRNTTSTASSSTSTKPAPSSQPHPQNSHRPSSVISSRKSPFYCPPTPLRGSARRERTPGSQRRQMDHQNLSESKILFNSPYRALSFDGGLDPMMHLSSPDELPQLRYLDVVGEGTSSMVYRVRNLKDGKFYAVKRAKQPFAGIKERDRALSEATSWLQVGESPYIVPMYRAWQEEGHLHMLMHLCEGGALKDYNDELASVVFGSSGGSTNSTQSGSSGSSAGSNGSGSGHASNIDPVEPTEDSGVNSNSCATRHIGENCSKNKNSMTIGRSGRGRPLEHRHSTGGMDQREFGSRRRLSSSPENKHMMEDDMHENIEMNVNPATCSDDLHVITELDADNGGNRTTPTNASNLANPSNGLGLGLEFVPAALSSSMSSTGSSSMYHTHFEQSAAVALHSQRAQSAPRRRRHVQRDPPPFDSPAMSTRSRMAQFNSTTRVPGPLFGDNTSPTSHADDEEEEERNPGHKREGGRTPLRRCADGGWSRFDSLPSGSANAGRGGESGRRSAGRVLFADDDDDEVDVDSNETMAQSRSTMRRQRQVQRRQRLGSSSSNNVDVVQHSDSDNDVDTDMDISFSMTPNVMTSMMSSPEHCRRSTFKPTALMFSPDGVMDTPGARTRARARLLQQQEEEEEQQYQDDVPHSNIANVDDDTDGGRSDIREAALQAVSAVRTSLTPGSGRRGRGRRTFGSFSSHSTGSRQGIDDDNVRSPQTPRVISRSTTRTRHFSSPQLQHESPELMSQTTPKRISGGANETNNNNKSPRGTLMTYPHQSQMPMPKPTNATTTSSATSSSAPSPPGLTDQHIWRCVYDGAQALSYIHRRGLVHNDIKPSNFYLGALPDDASQYRLLLGDFGQMTEAGGLEDGDEGDAVYMDRQVLNGVCDPTCDMFSFGLSIYEVAAQVLLPENGAMWHQLRDGLVPPLPAHRSSQLYELISALMSPNPADRPTAQSLLQHPAARVASESCTLEAVHDVCWGAPPVGTAAASASAAINNTNIGATVDTDDAELEESPVPSNRFLSTRTSTGLEHNSHTTESKTSGVRRHHSSSNNVGDSSCSSSRQRDESERGRKEGRGRGDTVESNDESECKIRSSPRTGNNHSSVLSPRRRLYSEFDCSEIEGAFANAQMGGLQQRMFE